MKSTHSKIFVVVLITVVGVLLVLRVRAEEAQEKSVLENEEIDLEETREEIKALLEDLRGANKTRNRLEENRDKLQQFVIANNENTALKMISTIATTLNSYRSNSNVRSFPLNLGYLKGSLPQNLIDATDAKSALYGYFYDYDYFRKDAFKVKAIPAKVGKTGQRTFLINQDLEITDEATGEPVTSLRSIE